MTASPDGPSEALARAIAGCDREPIHVPGAIQPHGVLFALRDSALVASSANAAVDRLDDWLDAAAATRVLAAAAAADRRGGERGDAAIRVPFVDLRDRHGHPWTGTLSRLAAAAPFLLALEPEPEPDPSHRAGLLLSSAAETSDRLRDAGTVADAARVAAEAIRVLTGFDRVTAYRFDPDWSGVVIAESLGDRDGIASFDGLRFPASDIPAQARALYGIERVRMIPDATAVAVPLRAARTGPGGPERHGVLPPIDLSGVPLRAVSPVHLAYLANMGVRASMSVAVTDEAGALWGLFACHHERGPFRPPPPVRIAAGRGAPARAARGASLAARGGAAGRHRVADLRERLVAELALGVGDVLAPLGTPLAAALDCECVVVVEGASTLFRCPAGAAAPAGLGPSLDRAAPDGELATDHLAASGLGEAGDALVAAGFAGLVAHRLVDRLLRGAAPEDGAIWIAWLRPERRRDVVWAGNPDKSPVTDANGLAVLSPRRSFAAWNEEVRFHSDPFGGGDRAAATVIAASLARALAQRHAATARAIRDLRVRNEQIRFFADAAVHDLREPLWQIQVFAGLLREQIADGAASADGAAMAEVIENSALRMRDMVDDLSRFAMAGADPDRLRDCRLLELVREAEADLGERLASAGGRVVLPEEDRTIRCDGAQIRRVFQNLLSNAVKYRDVRRAPVITVALRRREGGRVEIEIADNGSGFDPADSEYIFEPFRRLRRQPEADGSVLDGFGLGLAICRRIVEGHGGTITAEGSPGEGARFTIVLPEDGPQT